MDARHEPTTYYERQNALLRLQRLPDGEPLKAPQKLLLLILNALAGSDPGAYPSVSLLASRACCADKTVERNMAVLVEAGVVRVHRHGDAAPQTMPARPAKAARVRSNWYVIEWAAVFGVAEGDKLSPQHVGQGGGVAPAHGGDNLSGGARVGDKSSPSPRQNVALTPSNCRPDPVKLTDNLNHDLHQDLTTTSDATPRDADDDPGTREEVEGMLCGQGIAPEIARDLAGLEHATVATVGALIASVECDTTVQNVPSVLAHRVRHNQPPSPKGSALWRERSASVNRERLTSARRLERRLSDQQETRDREALRAEVAAWLASKGDDELLTLRDEAVASGTLDAFVRRRLENAKGEALRGFSVARELRGFEAKRAEVAA